MSANDYNNPSAGEASDRGVENQTYPDPQMIQKNPYPPAPHSPQSNGHSIPVTRANATMQSPGSQPPLLPRLPIDDAVASAFHTTDSSMSPEFIQLITQKVIQQMQAQTLATTMASTAQPVQPPTNAPADQTDNASSFGGSPTTGRAQVYTPPSPHRQDESLLGSQSIPFAPSASKVNAYGYETGIRREMSPISHSSDEEARPEPGRQISTDNDATLLEKVWGKLFDEQGRSTARLESFLRGIAVHLIENYEPKHSLVITTRKMQRYYTETKLTERSEIFPWQQIFDDKTSSISRLFREPEIKVQHHLVQSSLVTRPDIPGLTPQGFATWMTLLIRADPEREFERLAKTAREMPISNPDCRQERFPKELPRRLFPAEGDDNLVATLSELMSTYCKVQIRHRQTSNAASEARQSQPSPPVTSRKAEPPPPTVEDAVDESERRNSASGSASLPNRASTSTIDSTGSKQRAPTESAVDLGGSDVPTPRPIERERQPYVGQSGGGRHYDVAGSSSDEKADIKVSSTDQDDLRRTTCIPSQPGRARPPPPIAIHQRTSVAQPDGSDSVRSRSSMAGGDQGNSMYRTRSNSSYAPETQPSRRPRSNSTYGNDSGSTRYHPKRSPSITKNGFDIPRSSAPDMKNPNYPPPNMYSNSYPNTSMPHGGADYRSQNYDPRDPRYKEREISRDREHEIRASRPRMQSMAVGAGGDVYDEYYRQQTDRQQSIYPSPNANFAQPPTGGVYQYPPTAYRDSRGP